LFPIGWIVIASLILYRVTLDTGKFEIVKDFAVGSLAAQFSRHLQVRSQATVAVVHCLVTDESQEDCTIFSCSGFSDRRPADTGYRAL